ncbi:MAG: transcription termination factor Rho [Burkholderiales bacterium]|nr:transcription termination factor Rho [Burkholderiales bacterium]
MRDRDISQRRIYPAIDILRSGTRREELLLSKEQLQKVWILRKIMATMQSVEAIEFITDKLKETKNNAEFFDAMRR